MTKGITFNGRHSSEIPGVTGVTVYGFPLLGEMENTTQKVKGKDGEIDGGRTLNPLSFSMTILIDGQSVTDYFQVIFEIRKWLDVSEAKPFVYDVLPDRYLMARPTASVEPDRSGSFSTAEVAFTAYDPHFRSVEELTKEIVQNNLYSYSGVKATPFTLTVQPQVAGEYLRVEHEEQKKFLLLNRPMQVGDTVVFDTARRRITLNGQDVRRYLDSTSRYFKIDGDFTLSTNLSSVKMNIEYEERW